MITLSSDFGSPYPAAMKGVILQRSTARLVDVSHDFPRGDVRTTAFWLREILPYFPPAVHLVVVDPGVGTDRAALVVRAGSHALVGPDNGVLVPAARLLGNDAFGEEPLGDDAPGDEAFEVFTVDDTGAKSATFHGRDVFAPTAAAVHETGVERLDAIEELEPVDTFVDLRFPGAEVGPRTVEGEVLVVDDFGNAITNVPGDVLDGLFGETVEVNGESVPVERSYGHLPLGERLLTVGSHDNVELAVNGGRGEEAFDVERGATVQIVW